MANFLFWNMDAQPLVDLATKLVVERDVDVLLMAEPSSTSATLDAINAATGDTFREERGPRRDRIRILSRLPNGTVRPVADSNWARAFRLKSTLGDVLVAVVHMGSKLFADEHDQLVRCSHVARWVADHERRIGNGSRTLVVGDFNANPFDKGLTGTMGFHAVMSREVARARGRRVDGTFYPYFYNPMWSLLGDHPATSPPGSYYYTGKHFSTIWHLVDQASN